MTIHGFSAHRMGGIGSLVYLQLIDSPEEQSRFEELYTTYRKLMFHVAKGILGNDQDAEDAVHDAFLSIAKISIKFPRKTVTKQRFSLL